MKKNRRAIVSVSDKRGIVDFAKSLVEHGFELLSTGGTHRVLAEAGIPVTAVSDHTGAPEILDGRVKTLHPRIRGGILARSTPEHLAELQKVGIDLIDLVVVNLYPFERTIRDGGATVLDAVENIDIGGPCMARAAAKNHERVAVVVDPDDYPVVLGELAGGVTAATRRRLATKAFAHTAAYDGAIAGYLSSISADAALDSIPERDPYPRFRGQMLERKLALRYGENPHQSAAFYCPVERGPGVSLGDARVLQGKALSYNNLLDLDAALGCVLELGEASAVIVKHLNPCGVGSSPSIAEAYRRARATDPTSAFGGIVALNREVDEELAGHLAETFLECIVAPSYSAKALEVLGRKANLRLLEVTGELTLGQVPQLRSIAGGLLVQSADVGPVFEKMEVVTERQPTADERKALDFAWRVAKHVKSNATVFANASQTLAIGAGQMSRIDSVELCKRKAQFPLEGSCVASDAFFPFRDGLDALATAGASAVIQPGGSMRDDEVIAAANERGVAMIFTGMRHFRH